MGKLKNSHDLLKSTMPFEGNWCTCFSMNITGEICENLLLRHN